MARRGVEILRGLILRWKSITANFPVSIRNNPSPSSIRIFLKLAEHMRVSILSVKGIFVLSTEK